MATFELYRRSTIGMCLTETLDEMVNSGTLSPELAIQVLVQFDKSMTEALESQVKSKVTIKGGPILVGALHISLASHRDICTLTDFATMYGPSSYRMLVFKSEDNQENVGRVKIVACDSKLLTQ
ncbi:transcription initiation factor iia subunit 2 [Quercus suber]|uniref:Transcription initiation factor IIA subunit 2 n=1 Tax=Quercus suber TaxID=58331 RepID=A0AAW0M5S6_QUESU